MNCQNVVPWMVWPLWGSRHRHLQQEDVDRGAVPQGGPQTSPGLEDIQHLGWRPEQGQRSPWWPQYETDYLPSLAPSPGCRAEDDQEGQTVGEHPGGRRGPDVWSDGPADEVPPVPQKRPGQRSKERLIIRIVKWYLGTFCAIDCDTGARRDQVIAQLRVRGVHCGGCGEAAIRLRPALVFQVCPV